MANRDREDVIDTIIAEAYGEGRKGMIAVASVINNRAQTRGQSLGQVVRSKNQFDGYSKPGRSAKKAQQNQNIRAEVGRILDGVQKGTIADPTRGADHFYSGGNKPGWAGRIAKTVDIGGHKFYQSPQAASKLGTALRGVADAVTAPVRQAAASAGSIASALRTAAFPSFSAPIAPSRPTVDVPGGYDLPSRPMADVGYRMGQKRPNPPSMDLVNRVQNAATDVLGPNVRVDIVSGQGQYGSSRHRDPNGIAADVKVFDKTTGRYITDQRAMMDVAQAFAAQGGKGVGYGPEYMGNGTMHLDTVQPGRGQDFEWGSLGNRNAGLLASARNSALMPASFYERNLPKSMPAPSSRPGTPETMMAAPRGKVERAPLQAATMRAPDAARFAYDTQPNPERFGPRAPSTTTKTARLPSTSIPEPNPARFAYDVNPAPAPKSLGLVSPAAAGTPTPNAKMSLAQQYASYGAGKVPNPTPAMNAMMSPNVGPITQTGLLPPTAVVPSFVPATPPPTPITALKMPRVMTPTQRVDQAFQTASVPEPQFTAADVYAGRANSGAATGGNTVSRDQFGNISVTNKYGATTTTNANGQQMASSGPGIAGPIGGQGVQTPSVPSNLGGKIRGGLGTVVGGGLGGFLAGPVGAALGAVVAGDLAKGKNPLARLGIGTFGVPVTDQFGFTQQMRFANPKGGGPFPNAPSGSFRDPTFSNRSDRSMRDISPKAARDIKSGTAGLF